MEFAMKPFRSHGSAAVPHRKGTAQLKTAVMPPPRQVILPMQQHAGAPCEPLVKIGDCVLVGQKIADSESFVSAPIHASVSGKVSAIKKVRLPGGQPCDAVVIDSDGKMEVFPEIRPPKITKTEDFLAAVRESGLVGLGGAGFPTHVKLKFPKRKGADTLIINAAECEPYITSDHRCILEDTEDLLTGICAVKKWLWIPRVILAVEENKPDAIEKLRGALEERKEECGPNCEVLKLRASYPQGAEKVLIQSCTGRRVPMGGLPIDVGCVVMNVSSAAFLGSYLRTGMSLIKKRITVDGSAVNSPQNILVPVGTPIRDVIEACGGYRCAPAKILMGGPMMGISVPGDGLPVLKQNNAILCLDEAEAHLPEPSACIRCGHCVMACPMNLIPTLLEKYARAKRVPELRELGVMDCMECGSCAFNCPAGRPLVQAIRLGKALVRAEGK